MCLEALNGPGKFGSEQFTAGDQTWTFVIISTNLQLNYEATIFELL